MAAVSGFSMPSFFEKTLRPRLTPGLVVLASFALMLAAIGTLTVLFARTQDAEQLVSEQRIVSSAINDAMAKLGDGLRPNTYWDDGYNHLTDRVDAEWAVKNLGPYALETSGVSAVLVVPQGERAFYGFTGTEPDRNPADYESDAAVKLLVRKALATTSAPPLIATGFVMVGDRIYLGAASQVVPNDDRAKKPLARHNVEVYLQRFGPDRIAKVQRDFNVSTVSLSLKAPPPGTARLNLRDAAGDSVGYLWWRAATPGTNLARSIAPVALVIVALIGFLLWSALRGWGATLKDLERKRLEAALLRQESLAKSAFIGTISHELRTPLNAILGFSDILINRLFGPLGARQYDEYAGHIHSSGKSLLRTINDVIELSRLEGGDKQLSRGKSSIAKVVGDAMQSLAPMAAAKNVRLSLTCPDQSLEAHTSDGGLHDILVRLLDNAIKYSLPEGEVRIAVVARDGICIRICDDGIGIAPELLSRLGKPFSQGEGHLQRNYGGLGLGLAISHGLARQLDIVIALDSRAGEGASVSLRIPQWENTGDRQLAA